MRVPISHNVRPLVVYFDALPEEIGTAWTRIYSDGHVEYEVDLYEAYRWMLDQGEFTLGWFPTPAVRALTDKDFLEITKDDDHIVRSVN